MIKIKHILITFCLLLVFGFWWGATNRISNRRPVEPALMKVQEIFGKVFIRENLRSGWDDIILEDGLRPGTEIQTLENSQTSLLSVNTDGRVELGPNSQIYIAVKEGNPQIHFHRGEMYVSYHSIKDRERLKVNFKNIIIEMHDSDIFIYQNEENKINLSIPYGSIKIRKGENDLEFSSGQVIQFSNNSEFSVFEPGIKMLTPLNFDRFSTLSDDPIGVRFAWKNPTSYDLYRFYFGPSIQTLRETQSINNPKKNETLISLDPGFHYFRIYAFDKSDKRRYVYSDLYKIFVQAQATIQPLLPHDNAELELGKAGVEVKFQWDNPSQFEKLFLEVSKTSSFKDLAFHETIQGANFLFVNFEHTGQFYWRINGFPYRTSKLILGPTRRLVIKQ